MSLLVPGLTIFAQDLAAPMNCGQSSPPMVSSRNPRPTHLKPLPSDQGRTSGLPHPANLSPSGARSNRPHHPSAGVGASAKTQQQQSRGRAAALAQTYMPINRSELRQIVRMRAPHVASSASAGEVDALSCALESGLETGVQPLSAALGRASAARREAATVAKCYELFISEGTDPEVALHAARAHAIGVRQRADDAQRRRMLALHNRLGGKALSLASGKLPAGPPAEERPQTAATTGSRRVSVASSGLRPGSSRGEGGGGPNDPLRLFGYRTTGPIAAGAFSTVVRAKHVETSREVAVKTFLHRVKGGRRPDMASVRTELQCLQCLQKSAHAHIANLLEVHEGTYETHAILVLCSGGTLGRYMHTRGHGVGLLEQECAPLLVQVGSALAHLHDLGVTHRDVKPGNVVFDDAKRDTVRVVDFGFAKLHKMKTPEGKTEVRKLKTLCGSPAYMAPELCRAGQPYLGPPVDIWALGCMAFELLHNRPAFRAQSLPELNVRIMKRRHDAYDKSISGLMKGVIDQAWVVSAPERASAESIVELLREGYSLQSPETSPRMAKERMVKQMEMEEKRRRDAVTVDAS